MAYPVYHTGPWQVGGWKTVNLGIVTRMYLFTQRFGGANSAGLSRQYQVWMVLVPLHRLDMLRQLKAQHGNWVVVTNCLSWYCLVLSGIVWHYITHITTTKASWWYTYLSGKYEFISWD